MKEIAKDTIQDLDPYAYKKITIKHEGKTFKRLLQWDDNNKKFFIIFNKEPYEVTRDYTELATIFVLVNKIIA